MVAPAARVLALFHTPDLPEAMLLSGLAALGFEIAVVHAPGARHLDILRAAGIPCTEQRFPGRISRTAIRAIRREIGRVRPHLVHSFSPRALSNALIASRGMCVKHLAYRGTTGHLSRYSLLSRMTFLSRRLDAVICVSRAVRDYLAGLGVPERKLHVIYKGHDPAWYADVSPLPRAAIGVPEQAVLVGFCGNMRPVKGADILVRACASLPADGSVHLVLVGEVRDRAVLAAVRESPLRNSIHLTGRRDDALAVIRSCDVLAVPSRAREGLPKSLLEAMALGIAPVVSDAGGMPEVISNGEHGIVVPAGDAAALGAALAQLARDPDLRAKIARAARARLEERFGINETVGRTAELYRSLRA